MDATALIAQMAERGDLIGLVIAIIVAISALYLKRTNPPVLQSKAASAKGGTDRIARQVEDMDRRLQHVEKSIENMPTRDEMHQMQVSFARMDEKLSAVERTASQTGHAVSRIESFLINMGTTK